MFVHEYSNEEFETYEECLSDLCGQIDENDISEHLNLTVIEIIYQFIRRANNQNFVNWLEEKIAEAERFAFDELITEYEEEETE